MYIEFYFWIDREKILIWHFFSWTSILIHSVRFHLRSLIYLFPYSQYFSVNIENRHWESLMINVGCMVDQPYFPEPSFSESIVIFTLIFWFYFHFILCFRLILQSLGCFGVSVSLSLSLINLIPFCDLVNRIVMIRFDRPETM